MARFGRGDGSKSGGSGKKVPLVSKLLKALAFLAIPIWLLCLLGWMVQLAGVSAVQASQDGHFMQFDWFVTALEFVTLILIVFYLIVRRSTPGIVALKAVVTVLEILRTNVWNNARLGYGSQGANFTQVDSVTNPDLNASRARVNVVFAGYLITAAFNLMLLLLVGSLPAVSAQDGEKMENKGKEGHGDNYGRQQAEPFSTTAVAVAGPNETVTTVTEGPIYPGDAAARRV